MKGRLLQKTLADPFYNIALEEAIFKMLEAPVLRVWENQKCVVIGRAQVAALETNVELCSKRRIPVIRRFTAGGAVYNGPGNMNWSFFAPADEGPAAPPFSRDAKRVFESFAGRVTRALSKSSVRCDYEPPNKIINREGKVSGMAAYVSKKGVLCHGTLLVDADLAEVQDLTTPSEVKSARRYTRSNFSRVANTHVDRGRFVSELATSSEVVFEEDSLTGEELELAARLVEDKYGRKDWNLGDPFALDYL